MTAGNGTHNEVGLAGEFHVLAQLCQRGYSAHPTFGNTRGMDILVVDQDSGHMLKVEVKTARHALHAPTKRAWWQWPLSSKAEKIGSPNLVYCLNTTIHTFWFYADENGYENDWGLLEQKLNPRGGCG
jgi:hypothetical protein